MQITVLRLGHRPNRDRRMTTHAALVSRALGAESIVICEADQRIVKTVNDVVENFGGDFSIRSSANWKRFVRDWDGPVIHLTMYGEPLDKAINRIPKRNVLVIVGAEKVPPETYQLADFNISVTNQPHSEVAALAIFLDRMTDAGWTGTHFNGEKIIVPSKDSKMVINMNEGYLSDEDCRKILEEAGCDKQIIDHTRTVAKIAVRMAELCEADVDLVRTAALLHDIGRLKTHGPEHGFEGGEILRSLCFPEKIVSIVERHVGGGLDSRDVEELGMPERDFVPTTLEEKIVCIADKLIEDDRKVPIDREIQKLKDRGLDEAAGRLQRLYEEMEERCGLDLDQMEE